MTYSAFACVEQMKAILSGSDGGGLRTNAKGTFCEMQAVFCDKKEEPVLFALGKETVEALCADHIKPILIKEGRWCGKTCAFGDIMKSHTTSLQCKVKYIRIHLNSIIPYSLQMHNEKGDLFHEIRREM